MRYLQEEQYYIDRYDLYTIEECLRWKNGFLDQELDKFQGKELSPKKGKALKGSLADFALYFVKGSRYKGRSAKIQEWMEKDRRKDEKLESVQAPSYIRCPDCHSVMDIELKDLYWGSDDPLRVLFLYRCQDCRKGKAIFDNGEDFEPKPMPCPKCGGEIGRSHKRENPHSVTTIKKCKFCDYSETEIFNFEKSRKENGERERSERLLLAKYRNEYCMTDKEGQEYCSLEMGMERMNEIMQKQKEREIHKDVYDKVAKLKKLTIVELEKLLSEVLEKDNYIKLELSNPEMGQFVIVSFTVRDSKTGREPNDSEYFLKRLINKVLIDTNWRLMSEGVNYRLGILQGRLKAYDREEDLVKLVGGLKEEPGTKIEGNID